MKISAKQLGYMLAECFNAISPDTDAVDAARWQGGRLGTMIGIALRRDPGDVLWALEGCEVVSAPEDDAEEVAQEYGVPSEADRLWAAMEHDRVAQKGDDYAVPSQHEDPGDDIALDFIWRMEPDNQPGPNEYDLPDDPTHAVPASSGGALSSESAVVAVLSQASKLATTGFLCTIPSLDMVALARIRRRASWVKSVVHDAKDNGGRVDILSIFTDGTAQSSLEGYRQLITAHAKNGCGFEDAIWLEDRQDKFPFLASLPDEVVIDFPGIYAWGTKDEYGIVRMKREKDRRWKVGFEWIASGDDADPNPIFSDKVRIAVFVRPEPEKKRKK